MAVKILQHDKDEISWYHSVGIMLKSWGQYSFGYLTRNIHVVERHLWFENEEFMRHVTTLSINLSESYIPKLIHLSERQ